MVLALAFTWPTTVLSQGNGKVYISMYRATGIAKGTNRSVCVVFTIALPGLSALRTVVLGRRWCIW